MKKYFKFAAVFAFVLAVTIILTGCEPKRTDVTFKGEDGSITFAVTEESGCKISTDKEDLRTTREQGSLVCKNFKIGIEFDDDYGYFFDSDFNKLLEKRKADHDDAKEVTYGGYKGVQYFYGGYNDYEIIIPVDNNKDYMLVLSVYGAKDTEEAAKAAIKSEEVLGVLENIKDIKAKTK